MTTATTGAMQLARPACGDFVATLRTHGSANYVISIFTIFSVRARIAPLEIAQSDLPYKYDASVRARIAPLEIAQSDLTYKYDASVHPRIAPGGASFAEGDICEHQRATH